MYSRKSASSDFLLAMLELEFRYSVTQDLLFEREDKTIFPSVVYPCEKQSTYLLSVW
jgi:hypothetical protein